jgi:hypothetical protein
MKLIYCKKCYDVFKLPSSKNNAKKCSCGKSSGYYMMDGLNAVISGPCIPLGIDNYSFIEAISKQPKMGPGYNFDAFVIPEHCNTIKRTK